MDKGHGNDNGFCEVVDSAAKSENWTAETISYIKSLGPDSFGITDSLTTDSQSIGRINDNTGQ